ncbi:snurportin-1-like [Pollicipes pollicipes]|uniref:snurportin-1-like n=1 Tax=Pollicipes pollicipes TaxID=41117 RepID=UPI001885698A|nr:snurportin-1-like [Pollicipes pollicipes]XP_037082763.1 snurportin-1-like [Pollicipes pollicipes]XP_037082764.1 snurportin-1-like [Pollicipes pollicipes]
MDAVAAQLSERLVVDPETGASDAGVGADLTERRSQYKNQSRLEESQAERRVQQLERQKRGRDDRLDRLRALTADDGDEEEGMDTTVPSVFQYKKKEYYQSRYSNQLMFSEWMEEKPENLEADWLLKMCPPGKRCLVVAKRRSTRAYSAAGALLRTFPSLLPAGCRGPLGQRPTLLDCIWDDAAGTFHVLDLICWNGHEVYECETEFRFAWLASKLAESADVASASRRNPYRFCAVPYTACAPAELAAAAAAAGRAADGALFFHRGARYRPGVTPLVLWLKPFMLPEAVGVPMTAEELGAPTDYAGRAGFVAEFEEKRRKRRRPDRRQKMES